MRLNVCEVRMNIGETQKNWKKIDFFEFSDFLFEFSDFRFNLR